MNKISNFGFKKVTPNEKTRLVQKVFTEVANNYDFMNDIMSFGAHRIWKKKFVEYINPFKNDRIIDVGSGSGDLVLEIQKKLPNAKIDIVDLNNDMLNEGKKRITKGKIKFYRQNAESLDFHDNTYDKYIISFCLRNITDIDKSFKEALRVLKPGGQYFCLEFSKPNSFVVSNIYSFYKSNFIPIFGQIFSKNRDAYNYLNESIDMFLDQDELQKKLEKVGFKSVKYMNLFDGIVSIHTGYKY